RTSPLTDTNWDVTSVTFAGSGGSFSNSGAQLTIRDGGIINNSASSQTFANNIVLGVAQTWSAALGLLIFNGSINNGGQLLTVDGASGTTFNAPLSGAGGLTKNG